MDVFTACASRRFTQRLTFCKLQTLSQIPKYFVFAIGEALSFAVLDEYSFKTKSMTETS